MSQIQRSSFRWALITALLSAGVSGHAKEAGLLHLVCSGTELIEIIYGTELDPPRRGDFRVEYTFDLTRKGVLNARNGQITPVRITDKEFNFGSATDFDPNNKDPVGPKTNGTGANATGIVINRTNGKYFSISTRKSFSTDPPPEGSTEPIIITNVRTRQGVCTDGTPSPSF